jgi:hypothetical protein
MMKWKKVIPSWVVGTVIMATLAVTLYQVIQTQSALGWRASNVESPKSLGQVFFPGVTAIQGLWNGMAPPVQAPAPLATQTNAVQVPTIVAGSTPIHVDRGECTSCHTVLSKRGAPIPVIQTNSRPPHDNRGMCTNCHVLGGFPAASQAQAAGLAPAELNATAVALIAAAVPVGPQGTAPAMAPIIEGAWNGVEVSPITQLTATQYGVPLDAAGLVVAEAEGAGALAGLKAGDVITAVNGVPTPVMTDFFKATNNGLMPRASVTAFRKGQPLALYVDAAAGPAPAGGTPVPPEVAMAAGNVGLQVDPGNGGQVMDPGNGLAPGSWAQQVAALGVPVQITPTAGPVVPPPPEGEWLGLEVAPISSLTAKQYSLPPGLPGLVVVEAEAQAAVVGAKAGDVLQSVNGVPTVDMTTFFLATKNGTLPKGTIAMWRKGEEMVTKIGLPPPKTGVPQGLQPVPQPLQAAPQALQAAPQPVQVAPQPVQFAPAPVAAAPASQIIINVGAPWPMSSSVAYPGAAWNGTAGQPATYPVGVPAMGSGLGGGGDVMGYGMGLTGTQNPSAAAPFPRLF